MTWTPPPNKLKYHAANDGDFLALLGDDANKWAEAFCERYPDAPEVEIMRAWFANAIEHSNNVRHGHTPVLPDGSAFFVGKV